MSACKYGDPLCPCQDGDMCHYEGPKPLPVPAIYAGRMIELAVETIPFPTETEKG